MKNEEQFIEILKPIFFVSIFSITYILFYNQLFNNYSSDFTSHVGFINGIISGQFYLPHPLFHYLTYYVSVIFSIDIKVAAILVAAALVTALSIIVYKILLFSLVNKNTYFILFLVFLIMFSSNFYLPELGLTKHHYLGNGSIAVWHNVTLFMVKPFAVLSVFLLFNGLETNQKSSLFISCLIALISIYAKPSFVVIFLPTVFIFMLYMAFNKHKDSFCIFYYFVILLVVTSIILYSMFSNTYNESKDSAIIFAPFQVWNLYSNNILLSIVIGNLVVVNFIALGFKHISLKSWFSILMLVISILIFALFAESGNRFNHGNLSWSYCIAQPIAYLFVIIDFVNNYSKMNSWQRNILNLALSLHLIGGIYYFIKIFNGLSYA